MFLAVGLAFDGVTPRLALVVSVLGKEICQVRSEPSGLGGAVTPLSL